MTSHYSWPGKHVYQADVVIDFLIIVISLCQRGKDITEEPGTNNVAALLVT